MRSIGKYRSFAPRMIQTLGDPSRPAIVWIHGFMGSSNDWAPVINQLNNSYFHILIDLPGHHQQPIYEQDNYFEIVINMFLQWARENQPKLEWCVGYSLGGRVALMLAEAINFNKLLLISAHPGIQDNSQKQLKIDQEEKWSAIFQQKSLAESLQLWYQQPIFLPLCADQLQTLVAKRSRNQASKLIQALAGFSHRYYPFQGKLFHSQSIVYLTGQHDQVYNQLISDLAETFPKITHHVVPNCAHQIVEQAPDQIVNYIY